MKAKEIQDLISFLSKSGLEEVNIETKGFKVSIKRSAEQNMMAVPTGIPAPVPAPTMIAPTIESSEIKKNSSDSNKNLIEIKSPMIGTFYRSANPETPPFIEIGSNVKKEDIVCVIEAMKLFNEIESEVSGKIVKILIDNAQPVEYDQPLFLVEPS